MLSGGDMGKGCFVMIDGLDGSGKGTVIDALRDWAVIKNLKVLRLRDFNREFQRFPAEQEIAEYDVIITDEPTYTYVGKAIREELISTSGQKYSGRTIAQAFSLDRELLYKKVIIPGLKQGKIIFQERGVVSSCVYQPVQEHIPLNEIINMPGNRLALEHAPNLLIIMRAAPEVVIERLRTRIKKDDSIFETIVFQRKLHDRYSSIWLKQLMEKFGSQVEYLETNPPKAVDDTQKEAVDIWKKFYLKFQHRGLKARELQQELA